MATKLERFLENLTRSGLVSADEVAAVQESSTEPPADGQTLAKELVRQKT